MTQSEFHHHPDKSCPQPPQTINVTCKSEQSPWHIFWCCVFKPILQVALPIIVASAGAYWAYEKITDDLPAWIAEEAADCAAQGDLHPDPGANSGMCLSVKRIVHQSIDYERIKVKCPTCPIIKGTMRPLIRGADAEIGVERIADLPCGASNYRFTYSVGGTVIARETLADMNLPRFCGNGGRAWRLLDEPRLQTSRTHLVDDNGQVLDVNGQPVDDKDDIPAVSGGPYVTFIAMEERDRTVANAYFLYIDAVTKRPQLIDLNFETTRGSKSIVSSQGNVQLISNLKLDSIEREILFQIGEGASEMTIAGSKFDNRNAPATTSGASGSYIAEISDAGAVEAVIRRP